MKTTVLVEKIGKSKYRASAAHPIAMAAEGKSRDDAIRQLQQLARKRFAAGEWIQVELAPAANGNPWREFTGIWKDHPDFDAFVAEIAANRRSTKTDA